MELRAGDPGGQLPGGVASKTLVLFAADHEGGGGDLREGFVSVVGQGLAHPGGKDLLLYR